MMVAAAVARSVRSTRPPVSQDLLQVLIALGCGPVGRGPSEALGASREVLWSGELLGTPDDVRVAQILLILWLLRLSGRLVVDVCRGGPLWDLLWGLRRGHLTRCVHVSHAELEALGVISVSVGLVGAAVRLELLVQEVVHEVELRGLGADVVLGARHTDQVHLPTPTTSSVMVIRILRKAHKNATPNAKKLDTEF